jgi:hypothetical protein
VWNSRSHHTQSYEIEIPPRPSSSTTTGGTAAYHLPHSPYYGNPFYSGPFSSAVHHSNFGPFSVSAFGPFPSLFGLQFTYPPPPSSHVSSQNGASVAGKFIDTIHHVHL